MPGETFTYSTLEEIRDEHLRQSGDDADSNMEILEEESILYWTNRLIEMVWDAPFSGIEIGRRFIRGNMKGWSDFEDEVAVTTVVKTSLGAELAKGASTATLEDASNFPNEDQGFVVYDSDDAYDVATYTESDLSTGLTGVDNVGSTWASGNEVHRLYKMPADFGKPKEISLNQLFYEQVSEDPETQQFALVKGLLWLPRDVSGETFNVRYVKARTELANITDSMPFPKQFDVFFIQMLNVRFYIANGNPQADIDRAELSAYNNIAQRMGYDVQNANKRIRLLRKRPRSPSHRFNPEPTFDLNL